MLPGAGDADRGATAWSVLAPDPRHASVSMVQAALGGAPQIVSVPLVAPAANPEQMQVAAVSQIEGGVALRRRSSVAPGTAAVLELGWQNLWEGPPVRVAVRDAALLRDLEAPLVPLAHGEATVLKPTLVSVTAGGVFVIPKETGSQLFFIDRQGRVQKTLVPSLPQRALDQENLTLSLEGLAAAKTIVPLALVSSWGVLRAGPARTWDAMAFAPPPSISSHDTSQLTFAYLAGRPHVLSWSKTAPGERRVGRLFPFRTEGAVLGAPLAVPTQSDVTSTTQPCGPEKKTTARIVAPAEATARRAVIVQAADGSLLSGLVSGPMVLYGTPTSPCVSVVEATPVDDQGHVASSPSERVLVMLGAMDRSWWFRAGVSSAQPPEAKVLSCRIEANANLPAAVKRALATSR